MMGKAFMVYPSRYPNTLEDSMNAFYEHHKDSISFHYSCFDRMLLNATIQPFSNPNE